MRDYFKNIQTLLVVVLAALLFLQRGCSSTPPVEPKVITEVITKWDTLKVETKEYIPKYIKKTVVEIDTFQSPIDTISILKDYYAKYFYTDTIKVDSLGFIIINDTYKNFINSWLKKKQLAKNLPGNWETIFKYKNKKKLKKTL